MWITRYENETGRILGSEYHSSADGAEKMDTCALHGYYDPELFYYDSLAKKVLERPTMHIEISENTLTGLPLPCTVNVRRDNQTYRVEDGQFTYESGNSSKVGFEHDINHGNDSIRQNQRQ